MPDKNWQSVTPQTLFLNINLLNIILVHYIYSVSILMYSNYVF